MKGLSALALALALAVSQAAGAAVELVDPRNGEAVSVGTGSRATHVVFFATWCPTCTGELEKLGELESRFGSRGYRLVIVAVRTRQSAERLAEFVAQKHPPGLLLYDADGRAEAAFKATKLPTHVVLDREGREVARSSAADEALIQALSDLLKETRR